MNDSIEDCEKNSLARPKKIAMAVCVTGLALLAVGAFASFHWLYKVMGGVK